MSTRVRRASQLTVGVSVWLALGCARVWYEHRLTPDLPVQKIYLSDYDPRGQDRVNQIRLARESASFKRRLGSKMGHSFSWPGLQSAQVAWNWLELLQGMHNEASYEGDFSWMFSKLHEVITHSDRREVNLIIALAPFFMVIGHDPVGANILMNEMIRRGADNYNAWLWSAWHATENLNDLKFAADLYSHAGAFSQSPPYVRLLGYRLRSGSRINDSELDQLLRETGNHDLLRYREQRKPPAESK